MKEIQLRGKFSHLTTMVDDEDYEWLNSYRWYGFDNGDRLCVRGNIKPYDGAKYIHIWMSRLIMSCPMELMIDHIDHNALNNQKSNLRYINNIGNQHNQKPNKRGTKGICYHKNHIKYGNPWIASIKHPPMDGKEGPRVHLGYYETPMEAQIAYNIAAKDLYGDEAGLVNVYEVELSWKLGKLTDKSGLMDENKSKGSYKRGKNGTST